MPKFCHLSRRCFHVHKKIIYRTSLSSNSLAYTTQLNDGSIPDIFRPKRFIIKSKIANTKYLNFHVRLYISKFSCTAPDIYTLAAFSVLPYVSPESKLDVSSDRRQEQNLYIDIIQITACQITFIPRILLSQPLSRLNKQLIYPTTWPYIILMH